MFQRIRHWSSLTAVCALLCFTQLGHAQAPSANAARAEELLAQGIELRRDGKDAEALALFRQAADLDPESARAQAHLGVTNQALGRWLSADTYLSEALKHPGDPYIERHRAALEKAQEMVRDHIGSLAVDGGPAGADVSLNGRAIGRLPLTTQPVAVGSYLMEVSLTGHYSVSRPISVAKRALTRETVELVPYAKGEAAALGARRLSESAGAATLGAPAGAPGEDRFEKSFPSWVPWTLGGASAASAVAASVFWAKREEHAKRWNDNAVCRNQVGVTRENLCGDERDSGEQAQTLAFVSGGLAAAFAAGAIWTALAGHSTSEPASAGLEACGLSSNGVDCFGRF
jgi:tetratricopeptide (TPR) repeat protein